MAGAARRIYGATLSEEAMDKLQKDYQAKAIDLKRFQDDAQRDHQQDQPAKPTTWFHVSVVVFIPCRTG